MLLMKTALEFQVSNMIFKKNACDLCFRDIGLNKRIWDTVFYIQAKRINIFG